MLDLWIVLLPILLADVINPVLFAFMVYAVGTDRPIVNSIAALLGHTVSYLAFGIAVAYAFDTITAWLANPKPMDYGFGLIIGLLLLWVAWRSRGGDRQDKTDPQVSHLTTMSAFGFGAVINLIGIPFALPYLAALDQILKADLTVTESVLVIGSYNLGYALPFLVVPALGYFLGERSRPLLASINNRVDRISAYLMPLMLVVVGLALLTDAILYFLRGKGLF